MFNQLRNSENFKSVFSLKIRSGDGNRFKMKKFGNLNIARKEQSTEGVKKCVYILRNEKLLKL